MLQFGESFDYNGKNSKDFNLRMVRIDNLDVSVGLTREISKGPTNFYKKRANHYGTTYSDVLSFEIHLIKDECGDEYSPFTKNDIRNINAWLTSPNVPKKLHVYNFETENQEEYDYYGLFTDVAYDFIGGDGNNLPAAIKLTFTCDSPFGYVSKTQIVEATTNTLVTIQVENDEWEEYVFPLIKVETDNLEGATERTFSIINTSDNDRTFSIKISDKNTFWIDSQKKTIYDELGLFDLSSLNVEDIGYFYLPRLLNGENNLIISGNCTLTFSWEECRKTGAI